MRSMLGSMIIVGIVTLSLLTETPATAAQLCGCKNAKGRISKLSTPPLSCSASKTLVCWNETTPPGDFSASAYSTTPVSVPNVAYFEAPFDLEYYDTASLHDTVTNSGRFVAPVDGKYLVTGYVGFVSNATGIREVILFDSTGRFFGQIIVGASPTQETVMSTSAVIDLTAGQYVSVVVSQSSGGTLDLGDRAFQVHRLN